MAGRAFRVKVQLHVQAVTCPGVWLCPNGKVALQIDTLDCRVESRRVSPIFPLLFHDRFTFSKVFSQTVSLAELQRTLERKFLYAELVQWVTPDGRGIILATFEMNLADLLYPTPCFKGLLAGADVDLLMEPTKCFPGIIAPKIEVFTKTVIEEVLGLSDTSMSKCYVPNVNPKMIDSKQTTCGRKKRLVKGIIRQRKVCHTRSKPRSQSCRPYRQRSCSVGDSCTTSCQTGSQIRQCHHSPRRDSTCAPRPCFPKPVATCDNIHVTDNCSVCLKYNCYFSKCRDDSDGRYVDAKQRYHRNSSDIRECCCCVCRPNSVSDTQEEPTRLESKVRNLRKAREKSRAAETTADDVEECNPSYRFTRDHSSHGFYKNLEKFYKRMYEHKK